MFTKIKNRINSFLIRRKKNSKLNLLARFNTVKVNLDYKFSYIPMGPDSINWYNKSLKRLNKFGKQRGLI